MNSAFYYNRTIGGIRITEENGIITGITFSDENKEKVTNSQATPVLLSALHQLEEYFSGVRRVFDLPISFCGTEFQIRVWNELCRVEYGDTISYKELASRVGSPKAYRAVGNAVHCNPIAIVIPCHRVIGADGSIGGFAGGVDVKRYLLDNERRFAGGHREEQ